MYINIFSAVSVSVSVKGKGVFTSPSSAETTSYIGCFITGSNKDEFLFRFTGTKRV